MVGITLSQVLRTITLVLLVLLSTFACNGGKHRAATSFTGDVIMDSHIPGAPTLSGKIYLANEHLRLDWGVFADVINLSTRRGWRLVDETKIYANLRDKDLSTYAPEMTNGSICPHSNDPSMCKLVGQEEIGGRIANKWDIWNPKGFHVYYWTDQKLGITLRCKIDNALYEVSHLHENSVDDGLFTLPPGYTERSIP